MDEHSITSFEDLHKMVRAHSHGHFIYRGESDANYTLQPRYGRYNSTVPERAKSIEQSMLDEFRRRGAAYARKLPENEWEWLALAQHYGLATRLLDWTENPLVAAYFAVSPYTTRTDRVIYVLDHTVVPLTDKQVSPFEIEAVTQYRPNHIATRMTAQSGLFTTHPEPMQAFEHSKLERWVIDKDAVIEINIPLDRYGFNSATMFPDLDGLATHVNQWFLRK